MEVWLSTISTNHDMKLEQIYTGCLAHGAYYIASNGEAAIIDPLRETKPYIERAAADGVKIKYIFETHFHADFVSGHLDLAKETGAEIVYGPTAKPGFVATTAADGQVFRVGDLSIEVIHTPGHTMESSCFLLHDEAGKPTSIFTGDTLFIGDVGRPDLAQHVISDLTQEKLASHMYDSLRNKILPLPDDLIVYPGHGAGSACGKNMSNETTDTLGSQKATNYALQPMDRATFINALLDGLTPPPSYFPQNVLMNIKGYDSIHEVVAQGTRSFAPQAFEDLANEAGALVIDTRKADDFAAGHIPNSVNIGIDGQYANWVGTLVLDIQQPLLLVTDPGREEEAVTRLARVGYDRTLGTLEGGFAAWLAAGKEVGHVDVVTASELEVLLHANPELPILDVRRASEYGSQHLEHAVNAPLDYINESAKMVDPATTYYVHCAGGYRSMIFVSVLKARGFHKLINVNGGMSAIKEQTELALTDFVAPTTML